MPVLIQPVLYKADGVCCKGECDKTGVDLARAVGKGQWQCGVPNLPMGTLEFPIEGWKVVCRQVSTLETLCKYFAMNIMNTQNTL